MITPNSQPARRGGFALLEAVLAVAIFTIGVVSLGQCVEFCLRAGNIADEDARARRVLQNQMALIESGAKVLGDKTTEELKGMFTGMKLLTTRTPLKEKNEKGQEIFGLYEVTLEVQWTNGDEPLSRQLTFYIYPRQR